MTAQIHRTGPGLALLLVLLACCIFAAGCTGITTEEKDTGTETLRVATLNVIKTPSYLGDYNFGLMNAIANPSLLQMDSNSNIIGNAAKEWYANDDCTEWTFVIDDTYHWSDGTPLTAEDVAFSVEYRGEKIASSAWIAQTLTDTRVDGNTVTFTFNKPYGRLDLELLSYFIIPKHIWENIDNPEEYTSTGPYVGSGPYYIENIDINAAVLKFARNPYWKGTRPTTTTLRFIGSPTLMPQVLPLKAARWIPTGSMRPPTRMHQLPPLSRARSSAHSKPRQSVSVS